MNKQTDRTRYYHKKKSYFSTHTQVYTLQLIEKAINDYCNGEIQLLECGGGRSCFAQALTKNNAQLVRYDIVDNNEYAVKLFDDMNIDVLHEGFCQDLTKSDSEKEKYDFVFSIGLIEHFSEDDRSRVIKAHYDSCKPGGIVLISFPTPTRKYRFFRRVMEILHVWQFHDETPLVEQDVKPYVQKYAEVIESKLNKKLPLTQRVIISRKREE